MNTACHLRLRVGLPESSRKPRAAPPAGSQGIPWRFGSAIAVPVPAVVEMVRIADLADVPVILNGLVEPKLKVGGSTAPGGLDVITAVKATLPVHPPEGVTVIVEVFPVVLGATVTAVPLTVKLGADKLITYAAEATGLVESP